MYRKLFHFEYPYLHTPSLVLRVCLHFFILYDYIWTFKSASDLYGNTMSIYGSHCLSMTSSCVKFKELVFSSPIFSVRSIVCTLYCAESEGYIFYGFLTQQQAHSIELSINIFSFIFFIRTHDHELK